jgi:hypothetical protein
MSTKKEKEVKKVELFVADIGNCQVDINDIEGCIRNIDSSDFLFCDSKDDLKNEICTLLGDEDDACGKEYPMYKITIEKIGTAVLDIVVSISVKEK